MSKIQRHSHGRKDIQCVAVSRVAVTYHTDIDGAHDTAQTIESSGGTAIAVRYDLGDPDSIRAAVATVVQEFGGIDVLVNNAVRWPSTRPPSGETSFESVSPQVWWPVFENAKGPFATIQAVLPSMRTREWGRIVNISSNLTEDGVPGAGAYAASKAALHGLTAVLAVELAPAGILVNVVMPGMTLTERGKKMRPKELNERSAALTPTRRLTLPEDVANIVVFLGSAANGHINGETIRVTGGL